MRRLWQPAQHDVIDLSGTNKVGRAAWSRPVVIRLDPGEIGGPVVVRA